jgi:hypothetical protein
LAFDGFIEETTESGLRGRDIPARDAWFEKGLDVAHRGARLLA